MREHTEKSPHSAAMCVARHFPHGMLQEKVVANPRGQDQLMEFTHRPDRAVSFTRDKAEDGETTTLRGINNG
jgi:hypothetical protein